MAILLQVHFLGRTNFKPSQPPGKDAADRNSGMAHIDKHFFFSISECVIVGQQQCSAQGADCRKNQRGFFLIAADPSEYPTQMPQS